MLLYEDFLRELQFARSYSLNTISAYKKDLAYWEEFCKKKRPVSEIYDFLNQKKLSAVSQARVLSCIRTYLKFLQSRGKVVKEINALKRPRLKKRLPRFIRPKEFQALWQACEEEDLVFSLRNQLVLAFLYGLGCRVTELISTNVQDFNETEAWISLIGKGNKQRIVPVPQVLHKLIYLYLKQSRPFIGKVKSPSLFFNNRGQRPSRVDIWRWLKKWSLKAGFEDVKNPHSFRHGCATALLDKGADLRSIQQLLGHLNIQTTQIYTSVSSKKMKSAIKEFHPLSHIGKKTG